MSTLLLNLDFGEPPPKKALEGNAKHRKFVKKRRLLERKGFLNKKKQPPSKVPKLHSEPSKKGETPRVDGAWKATPLPKKTTAASSSGSEQSLDKKAAVPWLTPAPSQKAGSVVAKVDLLGEFQSALPKIKSHPTRPQKKGSQKNPPPKNGPQNSTHTHSENKYSGASQKIPGKMVAIDCEMVGTGPKGHVSSLARCSIVNYDGDVLYDEYILPPCHIVDYRTRWSGIRKQHMVNATPFKIARNQVGGMRDGGSSEADRAKSKSFFSKGYRSGKAPKDCGGMVGVDGVADKEGFSFGMKSGKNLETYK